MKSTPLYKPIKFILKPIFYLLYRPKVINKEYIPKEGPVVICGNHLHHFDPCMVIISTKRKVYFMSKDDHFKGPLKWFIKLFGSIPVNREIKDEVAKQQALEVLENECALGIFPEGTRNKTDQTILPFKFGAVSFAQKTGAYILPFAITGEYKVFNKGLKIEFSKPYKLESPLEMERKKLENIVKKLLEKD